MYRHANPVLKHGTVKLEAIGGDVVRIIREMDDIRITLTVNRTYEKLKIKGITVPAFGAAWSRRSVK